MKKNEDEIFEHFFAELRQEDEAVPIPAFRLPQKKASRSAMASPSKRLWRAVLGIAASGLLLFCFQVFNSRPASLHKDQLIISVQQDENGQATLDVRLQASIESWQAESDILLINP